MKYFDASFYYVRYSVLGKILRETFKKFNWRLWAFTIVFVLMYFVSQFLHIIFRIIDEVFYRNYKKTPVKKPVFIISNPRSGTTYLHRLISLDEEQFAYTKFAYTFQMTASFVKLANLMRWIDGYMGNIMRKSIDGIDRKLWGGWEEIHPMGFNKAEEDEQVFAQMIMSAGIFILFPFLKEIPDTNFLDHEPEEVRNSVMDFYESCIKRFMYASNGHKTYLAKNVLSTGRFKTLLQRFPDAKIIYIARHPYEAVPSFVSMFGGMYKLHTPKMREDDPAKRAYAQLGIDFFKYSREMKKTLPDNQFIELHYEELLNDPQAAVLKIYQHFNWTPSEAFLARLKNEQARNKNYKSNHMYSLEQYGFTKEEIYSELGDIMDEMGFEK